MNERHEKRKRWVQRGRYAVEVEVEVVYPADDPSEPCLEPATVRWLDEIARRAEQGDVGYLRTVGRVFEAVAPEVIMAALHPSLNDQIGSIQTRKDLVAFLRRLVHNLRTAPSEWENSSPGGLSRGSGCVGRGLRRLLREPRREGPSRSEVGDSSARPCSRREHMSEIQTNVTGFRLPFR